MRCEAWPDDRPHSPKRVRLSEHRVPSPPLGLVPPAMWTCVELKGLVN
jgi:hypothetical protein